MKWLKVGIIGCGRMGMARARALGTNAHVVAIHDPDTDAEDRLATLVTGGWEHDPDGMGRIRSNRAQDMLSPGLGLDAIIVSTSHDKLAEYGLMALRAGKHVLVEKPGAISSLLLGEMIYEAEHRQLVLHVGYNLRCHPACLRMASLCADDGKEPGIGRKILVRAHYGHGGRAAYDKDWRADRARSGGGELIDQGVHLIDLALGFLGKDLQLESACLPTLHWRMEVEDNALLLLRGDKLVGDRVAELHASWTEWRNDFRFELVGKKGKLVWEGLGGSYGPERLSHYQMILEGKPPLVTTWEFEREDMSLQREWDAFEAEVRGIGPKPDPRDALRVLRIVEAAYAKKAT